MLFAAIIDAVNRFFVRSRELENLPLTAQEFRSIL